VPVRPDALAVPDNC